ncbi:hypothetical protein J1614_001454 [Plenodomus biglobosus]|nr:hypothetical protein J1614_001454 [Plenodomus biglobosus]
MPVRLLELLWHASHALPYFIRNAKIFLYGVSSSSRPAATFVTSVNQAAQILIHTLEQADEDCSEAVRV